MRCPDPPSQTDLDRSVNPDLSADRQVHRTGREEGKMGSIEPILGRSAERTAEMTGTSPTKVKKARTVIRHADEETRQAVLSGEETIHRAYTETQKRRKIRKETRPNGARVITLEEWQASGDLSLLTPSPDSKAKLNQTNEKIEWAKWRWDPVTGCKHGCSYCYARDIACRSYEHGFEPTFYPDRLSAPKNTLFPKEGWKEIGYKNVFVCSMADLFGEWVPQEWIDAVLDVVRENPIWNFLFLTKNPKRMVNIDWSENAWVGTTVDVQARVEPAEEAFRQIKAPVTFVSCEPLRERITFTDMSVFHWLIIGGQSKSNEEPERQPEWEWVHHLERQARNAGCKVYFKPNLTVRPREYPVECK